MKRTTLIAVILGAMFSAGFTNATTQSAENPSLAALAEGQNGVIVGTTGPNAVHAGLETLKKGGSAADAAMATALAQVVECGGCYVSHAGILSMVYYEAETGKVHYLNAGFNTPLEEKDPLTPGTISGRQTPTPSLGTSPSPTSSRPALPLSSATRPGTLCCPTASISSPTSCSATGRPIPS